MCTVTWRREPGGFELLFNRDESKLRGPELAPASFTEGGICALAPTDSDCGGTWIAVNELGFAVCLVNGYEQGRGAPGGPLESRGAASWPLESRGRLVRSLAASDSIHAALLQLDGLVLESFAPFELVLLQPDAPATTYAWDGERRTRNLSADDRVPLASSGFDQDEACRQRREHFASHTRETGLSGEALRAFHASHAGGPSAYSACMHRADAETRSLTRVVVTAHEVSMHHTPGPPCRTQESPPLDLARRAFASGEPG